MVNRRVISPSSLAILFSLLKARNRPGSKFSLEFRGQEIIRVDSIAKIDEDLFDIEAIDINGKYIVQFFNLSSGVIQKTKAPKQAEAPRRAEISVNEDYDILSILNPDTLIDNLQHSDQWHNRPSVAIEIRNSCGAKTVLVEVDSFSWTSSGDSFETWVHGPIVGNAEQDAVIIYDHLSKSVELKVVEI